MLTVLILLILLELYVALNSLLFHSCIQIVKKLFFLTSGKPWDPYNSITHKSAPAFDAVLPRTMC